MNLPAFCIKRPVTTVMVILIVAILSAFAFTKVQLELMPEVNVGIAVVSAKYDGASVEEMETLVTKPLEKALGTVSNLKKISTTSSNGSSTIMLEFIDGTDMNTATLKMRENVDAVRKKLPSGVEPKVIQIDPNVSETVTIGVTGLELDQLKTLLDDEILNRFERVEGVGSVSDSGGAEKEISVEILPDKLLNYGISATQITSTLQSENLNTPGGMLSQGEYELQVRSTGEFTTIADIENLPIFTPKGGTIFLRDVAVVKETYKKTTSYAIINGNPGITVGITKQSSSNAVEVTDNVVKEIEKIRIDYPELELSVLVNSSGYVKSLLNNIWITIAQAIVLAFLVLLLFLGDYRTSLIISVAIPVSIISSLGLLYFFNMTLNMITLNGLLISVGMLVDNAIVVLESITRYIDDGYDPREAAAKGAQEVATSVIASTLTTVIVFVPVFFVTGLAGAMFGNIGFIIVFSLVSSLVVSLTFVPMACSRFLKKKDPNQILVKKETKFQKLQQKWSSHFDKLSDGYGKLINYALRHKKLIVFSFLGVVALTGSVLKIMGTEMIPEMDQGYIKIIIKTPIGSRLEEVSTATDSVLSIIDGNANIDEISVKVGSGSAAGEAAQVNESTIILKLLPIKERAKINIIKEELREQIGDIAGAEVSLSSYQPGRGGVADMMATNTISLSIYGKDSEVLGQIGDDVVERLELITNLRNIETSYQEGYPQARVKVNRNKAASYGLTASNVASTVQMAISGRTVTTYKVDGNEIDMVVRYKTDRLNFINDLENLTLSSNTGAIVPLSEIATITNEQSPASITKENYKSFISVSADFVNSDMSAMSSTINEVLKDYPFPNGYYYEFTGLYVMIQDSFKDLGLALVIGLLLVYMVIASQFESMAYPGTIMFSIPIAFSAGLFGLFLTGGKLGVVALLGLILLMGIVVNNGIVLVDYININRKEGLTTFDAIVKAGKVRLRPILMTTLTTVLGILPMLFASGDGNEVQRVLGAVMAFGLTFSTLVTLVLIPVLYLILHNFRKGKLIK